MTLAALARLDTALVARRASGLGRHRRIVEAVDGVRLHVDGRTLVSFASNDYLGLAGHPAIAAAARDAIGRWGVGAGASHLVTGHTAAHEALERELAAYVAPCEDAQALSFSSGYLANLAILGALAGRGDVIVADRLNHACLNDGALLARAALVRYAHADAGAAADRLAHARSAHAVVATDAVFSMDGDIAPLPDLLALAEQHDAWLVVDDAHGFGVLGQGRGSLAHFGIASPRIVYMGTLGKAAGVAGAFVAAHPTVIETILQTARPYIYTTAAPPLLAESLRAALALIRDDGARRAHLHAMIARFRAGAAALPWPLLPSFTAIQPLVCGASERARRAVGYAGATRLPRPRDTSTHRSAGDGALARVTVGGAHARRCGWIAGGACRGGCVNGTGLHVDVQGEGAPLVLLHGFALHGGLFAPIVPALSHTHRVHAVDLPGHGHSTTHAATLGDDGGDGRRGDRAVTRAGNGDRLVAGGYGGAAPLARSSGTRAPPRADLHHATLRHRSRLAARAWTRKRFRDSATSCA